MFVVEVSLSCSWNGLMEEKKYCFACCNSKLNKRNSSLMSSDLGFQVVTSLFTNCQTQRRNYQTSVCKNTKHKDRLITE